MKNLHLIVIFLICFSILMGICPVQAQGNTWAEPVRLSIEDGFSWFPSLAADDYGLVHVVWSEAFDPYDTVVYTATSDGINWLPTNDIISIMQTSGREATRPDLIINQTTSNLYLTYRYIWVYSAQANIQTASTASNWISEGPLNDVQQVAYYSVSKFDTKNTQHILITWNTPTTSCDICYHVYYRNLPEGAIQWTSPLDISISNTGTAKPKLIIDSNDNLHAVWETSDNGGGAYGSVRRPAHITYVNSTDGGNSWSEPVNFPPLDYESRNPAIVEDKNQNILITWLGLSEDVVYYQILPGIGQKWSTPQPIPGVYGGFTRYNTLLDNYSMAVDSDGNVHLVLVGRTSLQQVGLDILHLTWDGTNWSTPEVVASYTGDVPEWTQIAISNGNILNVVWYVRDEEHIWDSDNGIYTIWYSRAITSATDITPIPYPTGNPEAQTTVTPTIITTTLEQIASQTIPPPVPTNYVPLKGATYKETQYVQLLAIVLVPAALFVIGVTILVLYKKRNR